MRTDRFEAAFLAVWEKITKNGLREISEEASNLLEAVIADAETGDLGTIKLALEDGAYLGSIDAHQVDVEELHDLIKRAA
jgi:hypothetical protein